MSVTEEDSCFTDYEHYKEYRDLLIDGEQKVSEGLDKAILAISSAALGLTFAFSKSIMGITGLVELSWLKHSWLFLGASLCSVLLSLTISSLIYSKNRNQCDVIMANRSRIIDSLRSTSEKHPNKIEFKDPALLRKLNLFFHYISPALLIAGVLFIGIFFNLNFGSKLNEQADATSKPCTVTATTTGKAHTNTATSATSKTNTSKGDVND